MIIGFLCSSWRWKLSPSAVIWWVSQQMLFNLHCFCCSFYMLCACVGVNLCPQENKAKQWFQCITEVSMWKLGFAGTPNYLWQKALASVELLPHSLLTTEWVCSNVDGLKIGLFVGGHTDEKLFWAQQPQLDWRCQRDVPAFAEGSGILLTLPPVYLFNLLILLTLLDLRSPARSQVGEPRPDFVDVLVSAWSCKGLHSLMPPLPLLSNLCY